MSKRDVVVQTIERARQLASMAQDAAAKSAYIDVLRRDPAHFSALTELAALAHASGHRTAARTAYEQAVLCHPHNPMGRVNLGNLLVEYEDFMVAREQYEAALAVDTDYAEAHQGLARVLTALGDSEAAAPHWHKGFAGHAMVHRRYRGTGTAVPVLLLVSARGGNIPTHLILDDRIFAVTALYTEYYDPAVSLPPHAVVFNAIGDADLCAEALTRAETVLSRTTARVINQPDRVGETGRAANARRLAGLPGVVAPTTREVHRDALLHAEGLIFPLLLRTPGFHTGQNFLRIERQEALAPALASLPGDRLLAIDYLDARGADGMARKYRVMIIDGKLYPLHLAISADWKVHYFTSAMAGDAAYREEERYFLEDMAAVLGSPAMAALAAIGQTLGLDYAGVDFGIGQNGSLLLFEANATMVINPPDDDTVWEYRRAPITRALDAAKRMLTSKAHDPDHHNIVAMR